MMDWWCLPAIKWLLTAPGVCSQCVCSQWVCSQWVCSQWVCSQWVCACVRACVCVILAGVYSHFDGSKSERKLYLWKLIQFLQEFHIWRFLQPGAAQCCGILWYSEWCHVDRSKMADISTCLERLNVANTYISMRTKASGYLCNWVKRR